ncbi:DnaJ domain-containing protein [Mycobacterium sp. 88mf]|nr:DnaJ domain-containing protein [Mycobacterium sp. 88mf]SFF65717.1 DnaJ domain-containing protein [Mycobacterium sp. 455mf]
MCTQFDPYRVLGVSPAATQDEITHAYRIRLRAHHPDTRQTLSGHIADEHLQQLLTAYAQLRDPARRAEYDRATGTPQRPIPADHPAAGAVSIPVTHRSPTTDANTTAPLLRAGPVRRHR